MNITFEMSDYFPITDETNSIETRHALLQLENALYLYNEASGEDSFEIITEAVDSPSNTHAKAVDRSNEISKTIGTSYDNITTGGGNLISAAIKLVGKIVELISRLIGFILTFISRFPAFVTGIIDGISQMTMNVVYKLSGKLALYFTIDDLAFFDERLQPMIEEFLVQCEIFSDSDGWTTSLFNNDFKRYNRMLALNAKLSGVKFEKTLVKSDDQDIIDTYFNKKSDYYKKLLEINKFFAGHKKQLEDIKTTLKQKLVNSKGQEGSYFELKPANRAKADHSIKMVADVIKLIASFQQRSREDLTVIAKISHSKSEEDAVSVAVKYGVKL